MPLFKNFLQETFKMQNAKRSNYLALLQYHYVYIRNEKF